MTPDRFKSMLVAIVARITQDYTHLFDLEQRLLGAADHYDRVRNWLSCSDAEFDDHELREQLATIAQTAADALPSQDQLAADVGAIKKAIAAVKFNRGLARDIHRLLGGEKQCKICFGATADTALVPCGHALCGACAARVSCCPYCNLTFCTKQRIYYM